jgi:hypothetical protein
MEHDELSPHPSPLPRVVKEESRSRTRKAD